MLARHVEDIPFDHYVDEHIQIDRINIYEFVSAQSIMEDVTCHSTTPSFRVVGISVFLKNGKSFMTSPEYLHAALNGGGSFFVCYPNAEHKEPITLEEYERRLEREAEEAFWDYY